MAAIRLITWNCHHGSLERQLRPLAKQAADVVFLQEWLPSPVAGVSDGQRVTRHVRQRKGIALCAMNDRYRLNEITSAVFPTFEGHAVVAAEVSGPVDFIAIGLWSRGPNYAAEVLRFLESHRSLLRSAPTVVMGDLNTGSKLGKGRRPTRRNGEVMAAFADAGLVSAYHEFHNCLPGDEAHATYRHLFKRRQPWHIDLCFVPDSWRAAISAVSVLDSRAWAKRSDHNPVQVDVTF